MIGLSVASQVLLWGSESTVLRHQLECEYDVLLHEALRYACCSHDEAAEDNVDSANRGDALAALAGADTPADAIRQVMRAPRTVSRLLWPRTQKAGRTQQFLRAAFAAERALRTLETPGRFSGWTADCRAFVRSNGEIVGPTMLDGGIPIDVRSPHARSLDLLGGSRLVRPVRPSPSQEDVNRTVRRIDQAWRGIGATGGTVADCVSAWTRVIVAQTEPSGKFWSGSNGQYVGRVVLVNADVAGSPVEEVADAIVHEAIHGFLYMHECVEPWVRGYSLYTDEGAIPSPWSGNLLPVRPYMQACFVWYGLAMFWAQHIDRNVFDQKVTYELLNRALIGFRRGSLADAIMPWRAEIHPEMAELVDELQRIVRSLLE